MASNANKAAIRLQLADGTDLADKIDPRFVSLTLTEKRGEEADELELVLHNADGKLEAPEAGVFLSLAMGWKSGKDVTLGLVPKGRFKVDEVEISGPPDIISIRARAADLTGDYRKRKNRIFKQKTLGEIIGEIAADNDLTAKVHPDLAGIVIDAIEQAGKSDMVFVRDLGRRYDAIATAKDKALIFMPIGAATTPSGKTIPELKLTRKDGWRSSFRHAQRDEHDGATASYQDSEGGTRKTVKIGGKKKKRLKKVYANKGDAEAAAKSAAKKTKRGAYTFEYDLALGDPTIIPNRKVTLSGWGSKIDGIAWLVDEASTKFDAGGLSTSIKLESAV